MNAGHRLLPLLLFNCLLANPGEAAEHRVDSLEALQLRAAEARPGDRIVLKQGVYIAELPIRIECRGAKGSPIVIAAESTGGVEIQGKAGFHVLAPAEYIQLEGFVFTHAGKTHFGIGTAHCRIVRNVFENRGVTSYLVIDGDDTEIAYNEFRNKKTVGQMLKIGGATTRPAERTWAHHNYFHDFTNVGSNGGETIQVAVGENSMRPAYSVIEYNLFERCNGENELISNKSCDNVYRGNTFRDSPDGELTLRDGDRIVVEANYFINTQGLRIFGDDSRVVNNYFERCKPALLVGSGTDADHILGQPFKAYDRVDGLLIAHNTFVNNAVCIEFQNRKGGLAAQQVELVHNLLQGDEGRLVHFALAPADARWKANGFFGAASPGDAPAHGFRRLATGLIAQDGVYRLAPGSPAIDAGDEVVPNVPRDIEGQTRTGPADLGADEWSSEPPRHRPLLPADVGPQAAGAR